MAGNTTRSPGQKSLILLLPLLCLALISSGLDPRLPQYLSESMRVWMLSFSSIFLPGLFAAAAACMIPTNWRFMQVISVACAYSVLTAYDPKGLQDLSNSPTVAVLSALAAALLYLPSEYQTLRSAKNAIYLLLRSLLLSGAVYVFMLSVIAALANFIDLTFGRTFQISALTAVIAPIFTVMQTAGYTAFISELQPLQSSDPHMLAVSSAVVCSVLISLPILMLASAVTAKPNQRLFLISLGIITLITSHIGVCVSIELTVLLLFFPGTYVLLLLSSTLLAWSCYMLQANFLSGIVQLYQPDLIMNSTDFFGLNHDDRLCLALSVFIPALLVLCMWLLQLRYGYILKGHQDPSSMRYLIKRDSNPDLVTLALLRAIGGLSNIKQVHRQGGELLIEVSDLEAVSAQTLTSICRKRPGIDRMRHLLICYAGANSSVITRRLSAFIANGSLRSDNAIRINPKFSISDFVKRRDQQQGIPNHDRQ